MRMKRSLSVIIYSLLRATKERTRGKNVLVMMSVGVTEIFLGPYFTGDLSARLVHL